MTKLVSMITVAIAAFFASQLSAQASLSKDAKQLAEKAQSSQNEYVKIASNCGGDSGGGCTGCM